jgi:hypothetical protein
MPFGAIVPQRLGFQTSGVGAPRSRRRFRKASASPSTLHLMALTRTRLANEWPHRSHLRGPPLATAAERYARFMGEPVRLVPDARGSRFRV